MRLKTLLPLILLTLLLTPPSFTQTPPESPESSASAYGIDLEESYPGTLVLDLMELAEEEIGAAIDEAYAEGYKAAMVQYAPDAALYKALSANIQAELEAERKKNRFLWPAVGISAGLSFGIGFLCSFLILGR
ncbi:MAG: hypothetical protein LBJ24_06410 [Treponema sp.]|nr:hypothetical protein [Treponema sp.]